MANNYFIKNLLNRRIPHILGSYFIAGTSFVLFVQYLVDKYQFPIHSPTLALFGIIGILPSVIILAYFHGAPGKDSWNKIEKIGVPINILFLGICLIVGNKYGLWEVNSIVNKDPNRYVIVLTNPLNWKDMFKEDNPEIEMFLLNNKNADIFDIPQESINQLHMNIEASLLSKFYDENLILDFKMDEKDVTYMHDILKSSDQTKEIALKLYNLYKHPEQIIYVFTAALINDNGTFENFIAYTFCYNGNPENGSVSVSDIGIVKTISEVEENISSIIEYNIWEMEHDNPYGTVVSVEDDIIIFHPGKMNLKKNMTLMGFTEYFLTDKDNDGFTDKDAGLQKRIDDLKSALDYIENNKKDFNLKQTNSILKAYERYSGDSLSEIAQGYYTGAFSYKLKIISVADTIVVGKLIKRTTPWSKIRPGDKITLN